MNKKQTDMARHALGLDGQRKQSYRNRYVVGSGNEDCGEWEALVANGDATKRDGSTVPFGGDHIFYLTEQGAMKVLKKGERLCPEDFPEAKP